MTRARAGGLFIQADPIFRGERVNDRGVAEKNRLPTVLPQSWRGGCGPMSYGTNNPDLYRRATYVDKILKGAKPADLPVEQPTEVRTGHQP